jgi:hypothetical protein
MILPHLDNANDSLKEKSQGIVLLPARQHVLRQQFQQLLECSAEKRRNCSETGKSFFTP